MSEWVWFAPNGDLSQVVRVSQGAGAGLDSVPTFSGGVVWIGGSRNLTCANPATGQVMASTAIPTDNSVVEYFGSVTVAGNGRTYALYQNQAAQQFGIATLTPPAACSG
jgi:outer membrane protein assembly factor BamB